MRHGYHITGSGRPMILEAPTRLARGGRALMVVILVAAALKVVFFTVAALVLGFSLRPVAVQPVVTDDDNASVTAVAAAVIHDPALDSLRRVATALEAAIRATAPRGAFVVVDRHNNRLWLRKGTTTLLDATVSTGSGTVLRETSGSGRTWKFETPSGRLRVISERPNPVWTKPDWAFLEEGRQPPANISERREKGSLGEWALDLGDGYMIHGTLYERLLGRSLTHGCIRVGRDDLRALARAVGPGTPVFVF